MKAKYDDISVELTPRYVAALIEIMVAECEMMAQQDPGNSDCWTWGRCFVGDLASVNGLDFHYGGDEDKPDDGLGDFAVLVVCETLN